MRPKNCEDRASKANEPDPLSPRKIRVRRLRTLHDVGEELAGIYRAARRGELDPAAAGRLCYVLSCLGKVLEVATLERRLGELERDLESLDQRNAERRAH